MPLHSIITKILSISSESALETFDWQLVISDIDQEHHLLDEMLGAYRQINLDRAALNNMSPLPISSNEHNQNETGESENLSLSTSKMSEKMRSSPLKEPSTINLDKAHRVCCLLILYAIQKEEDSKKYSNLLRDDKMLEDLQQHFAFFRACFSAVARDLEVCLAKCKIQAITETEILQKESSDLNKLYTWRSSADGYKIATSDRDIYITVVDLKQQQKDFASTQYGTFKENGINHGMKFHVSIDPASETNLTAGIRIVRNILLSYDVFAFKYVKHTLKSALQQGKAITVYAYLYPDKNWQEILEKIETELGKAEILCTALPDNNQQATINAEPSQCISFRNDYFRKDLFDDEVIFAAVVKKMLELSFADEEKRKEAVDEVLISCEEHIGNERVAQVGFVEFITGSLQFRGSDQADRGAQVENHAEMPEFGHIENPVEEDAEGHEAIDSSILTLQKYLESLCTIVTVFVSTESDEEGTAIVDTLSHINAVLMRLSEKVARHTEQEQRIKSVLDVAVSAIMAITQGLDNEYVEQKRAMLEACKALKQNQQNETFEQAYQRVEVVFTAAIEYMHEYYKQVYPYYCPAILMEGLLAVAREKGCTNESSTLYNPFGFDNLLEKCEPTDRYEQEIEAGEDEDEDEEEGEEDKNRGMQKQC